MDDYKEKIQFKSIPTDADAVYRKVWCRIQADRLPDIGVSPVWKYISIAASFTLLVMSVYMLLPERPKSEPIAYMEVSAVPGSKVKVVLPDSSTVWLNSNTTIRYPQRFTAGIRSVEFTGEALFNVVPDKEKPFVVNTNGFRIQVLGTKFNVFTSPDLVEATLLEGSIALFKAKNQTNVADLILAPDQQALYQRKSGEIDLVKVKASCFTSWVDGQFMFKSNTLEEIVSSLQRAFNVKIHIQGEKLKRVRLTAQFFHQETLDEILSILQISAHYTYKKEKGEIYIREK